jgi:hypothetical protein
MTPRSFVDMYQRFKGPAASIFYTEDGGRRFSETLVPIYFKSHNLLDDCESRNILPSQAGNCKYIKNGFKKTATHIYTTMKTSHLPLYDPCGRLD